MNGAELFWEKHCQLCRFWLKSADVHVCNNPEAPSFGRSKEAFDGNQCHHFEEQA